MSGREVTLIGAAPLLMQPCARHVILGCSCGHAFLAACSLHVRSAARTYRHELTSSETAALANALADTSECAEVHTSRYVERQGADCILVISEMRVLLRGEILQCFAAELRRRHAGQRPPVAGELHGD